MPITPRGVVEVLARHEVDLSDAEVVVIGRSVIVGRTLDLIVTRRAVNATVTSCHTGTRDRAAHTRRADVVVAAAAAGVVAVLTGALR